MISSEGTYGSAWYCATVNIVLNMYTAWHFPSFFVYFPSGLVDASILMFLKSTSSVFPFFMLRLIPVGFLESISGMMKGFLPLQTCAR